MKELGINTEKKFRKACKHLPIDIPRNPEKYYKERWKGFSDFLDNGFVPARYRSYRTFQEAKNFVKANGISTHQEWLSFNKSGVRPIDIPLRVELIYKSEWKGWDDFFGRTKPYREIGGRLYKWRPYEAVKKFAIEKGIKSQRDWINFCQSGNKPKDIPRCLMITYKNSWKGWNDFLNKV